MSDSELQNEIERLKAQNAKLYRLLGTRTAEADESLHRLTQILANIPDALVVTDIADRVKVVNRPVFRMFDVSEMVVGQPLAEFFDADLVELIVDARESGAPVDGPVALRMGRIGEAHCNPLRGDDGEPHGAVVVVRDVTYERELDRMKSEFIANVSHELRTPLTSILGFARIIQKRLTSLLPRIPEPDRRTKKQMDQLTHNVDIVVSESRRLTSLVNDVLDLSRLEAGAVEFEFEAVAPAELVRMATEASSGLFGADVQLETVVPDDLPAARADSRKLMQVLVNLLSNAFKFTPAGFVRCSAEAAPNGIVFRVRDTGVGIADEHQASIFERFRQVGDAMTDKPVGTGLGLALCREIVERHDGRIWLDSVPGEGTTFSFVIPAWRGATESAP